MRRLYILLNAAQQAMLDDLVDYQLDTDPPASPERWCYLIVRGIAGDWARTLDRLDAQGFIEATFPDGTTQKIHAEEVRFSDFKAPEVGPFSIRMPDRMLEKLERGVALQARWNEVLGETKSKWTTFPEWVHTIIGESLLAVHPEIERKRMEEEGREFYADPPAPKPAAEPANTPPGMRAAPGMPPPPPRAV